MTEIIEHFHTGTPSLIDGIPSQPYKVVGENLYCKNTKDLDCDKHPQHYVEVLKQELQCTCGEIFTKIVEFLSLQTL